MTRAIQVEGLIKTYGVTRAVDGITFDVQEGEIFGIVGPNGAGKTTAIECLEGLRKPDAGSLLVLGLDPQQDRHALHGLCGVQLQKSTLPERIKVWEALDLYSSFYEHPADWTQLLAQLGLEDKRGASFASLSGGQKQRLFIALALLPNPRLVFLDELTTGLDPQARHATWDLIREVRSEGKTILLTTHFMEEAERLCDRVAILDRGRIVALDSPEALIRSLGNGERVVFTIAGQIPPELFEALGRVGPLEVDGDRVSVQSASDGSQMLVDLVGLLAGSGVRFQDLHTEQPSLEDVFLKLTGTASRE
jgi:ABC-2 type transport system ATP-binding protein